jgi:hypothetical protein
MGFIDRKGLEESRNNKQKVDWSFKKMETERLDNINVTDWLTSGYFRLLFSFVRIKAEGTSLLHQVKLEYWENLAVILIMLISWKFE